MELAGGALLAHVWSWPWVAVFLTAVIVAAIITLWKEDDVPSIDVDTKLVTDMQDRTVENHYIYIPRKASPSESRIQCFDPATMEYLGFAPVVKAEQVREHVAAARAAQKEWGKSSFRQRRLLLRVVQKYILEHQDVICRAASRDSGKSLVDCEFGEIFTTCEKISWLIKEGQKYLRPEYRSAGRLVFYKSAQVHYVPVGVVGAIVPWNYPFHNIFSPILAALFAGNGVVVKVSEHASWSVGFFRLIIEAALGKVGAPRGLVHVITGYGRGVGGRSTGETGEALVTSGVDKLVFIGSTAVGRKVYAAAAATLTPVVLELGGKDALVVCEDADLEQTVPIALRAIFQASGQNCIGAERFFVHTAIHDEFVKKVVQTVQQMRMGAPLSSPPCHVDMGALCLPRHSLLMQSLVEQAVGEGARVEVGGVVPAGREHGGQFYPPTVLTGVQPGMRVMREEVFGPIMSVVRVDNDDVAVRMANESAFGLGCSVFSKNIRRAEGIAARIDSGMASINDFGATYMCQVGGGRGGGLGVGEEGGEKRGELGTIGGTLQSLPFGGRKESGFGQFGGVEGLRGCCVAKAVAVDRWPRFIQTRIPKLLQYPVAPGGFLFQQELVRLFYGMTWRGRVSSFINIVKIVFGPAPPSI